MNNGLRIATYLDTFSTVFKCRTTDIDKTLQEIKEKIISLPREFKMIDADVTIEIAIQPHNAGDIVLGENC
ncbi:MAG: hypothetical protein Q7K55_09490 [Candidatus Levybacteria bacterium]|nr:hypothetical protein [Candidatus Levybacteria bacterium]